MFMRRGRGPHVAIIACLRSACGSVILVDRRACPVDSASPRQTDRPRSPLHRPAAELSRDAARTPTDGTHTVGGGRPQLCAWNLQPADPYPRNLRRAALVVAAIQSATVRNTRGLTRSAIALMTSPLPAPPRFSKRRRNLPPFRDDPQLQLDRFGVQLRELALTGFSGQFIARPGRRPLAIQFSRPFRCCTSAPPMPCLYIIYLLD